MRFFFYGTLMAGSGNAMARRVEAVLRPLGPAFTQGALYALPDPQGWYPALLAGAGKVRGLLYESTAGFAEADLAQLDAYEDFDPCRPEASLYCRRPIAVAIGEAAAGSAEAYLFNQPLPAGARPVPGGDFRAWLAEHRLRPFAG